MENLYDDIFWVIIDKMTAPSIVKLSSTNRKFHLKLRNLVIELKEKDRIYKIDTIQYYLTSSDKDLRLKSIKLSSGDDVVKFNCHYGELLTSPYSKLTVFTTKYVCGIPERKHNYNSDNFIEMIKKLTVMYKIDVEYELHGLLINERLLLQ